MVFYFSGTGNSQLAAKQLAAALGDALVSINQALKSREQQTCLFCANLRWKRGQCRLCQEAVRRNEATILWTGAGGHAKQLCGVIQHTGQSGLNDGKPVWHGNCTHCMACIGGCPAEAIEYKAASKEPPILHHGGSVKGGYPSCESIKSKSIL